MATLRIEPLAPSKTVLLLIDFINPLDFEGAADLAPSALQAAIRTEKLRRDLCRAGARTVYANDNYGMWTSDFKALWAQCSKRPGESGRISRLLKPRADDFALLKPRHSAFYATSLDILLKQLRCRKLVIAGIAADSCVLFSAMDAYLRDYALWIPADCVAAETTDARDRALNQMTSVLKAVTRPAFDPVQSGPSRRRA